MKRALKRNCYVVRTISVFARCGGQNKVFKDIHTLIPGTCEYVTLYGKVHTFIKCVIKVKNLEMRRLS